MPSNIIYLSKEYGPSSKLFGYAIVVVCNNLSCLIVIDRWMGVIASGNIDGVTFIMLAPKWKERWV